MTGLSPFRLAPASRPFPSKTQCLAGVDQERQDPIPTRRELAER